MSQPFTIFVMQSAHTDIGYTHPQEQIADMYLDHYDTVLALCRATADAPEAQRFKWTCETFWQVEHYLRFRPQRLAEFLYYVRNGQIEVTASYLHFTDLIDAEAYAQSFDAAVTFAQTHNIPLKSAMHADINGWPWALPAALQQRNIPYYCSMIHIDSGTNPLGVRGSVHYMWTKEYGPYIDPQAPIRVPELHRWQGAQGGEVLHWLNEHYLLGNVLGVSSPQGFHADKTRYFTETDQLTVDDLYARAHIEVPAYVRRLQASGYPHAAMLLSTGGFYVDNSPPDGRWLDVIARWNAEHSDIVMRTATLSEWFAWITAHHPHPPVYRAAWPDHWAHGLGSMTASIAQARRSQRRRAGVAALVAQSADATATQYFEQGLSYERFALEHTFNAWLTTARPAASVVNFQQAFKELNFHRTELMLDEAATRALRTLYARMDQPALIVDVPVADALVHFRAADVPLDPDTQVLMCADGRSVPFQQGHTALPTYVARLTGFAAGRYVFHLHERTALASDTSDASTFRMHNADWELVVDPTTGGLTKCVDRHTQHNWVAEHQRSFGQMIHEAVTHPQGRHAVSTMAMLKSWGVAGPALQAHPIQDVVAQSVPHMTRITQRIHGPVFDAIVWQGASEKLGKLRYEWRLYHQGGLVELHIEWDKVWSDAPEAVYVAFPFQAPTYELQLESSGGFFTPGSHHEGGQIPGTCNRYYTVQRAAVIANQSDHALIWAPLDAPLVVPNDIMFTRWEVAPWQWNGVLASMPVNHYWHTNFPTSQRGPITLRYLFASSRGAQNREHALQSVLPHEALGWR